MDREMITLDVVESKVIFVIVIIHGLIDRAQNGSSRGAFRGSK